MGKNNWAIIFPFCLSFLAPCSGRSKSEIMEAFFKKSYTNFISFRVKFFHYLPERHQYHFRRVILRNFVPMLALKGFLLKVKHCVSSPFPGYSTTKRVHESLKLKKKYAKRLAERLLFMTNSTFPNFPSELAPPSRFFRICPHSRTIKYRRFSLYTTKGRPQVYAKSANNCGTQKKGSN